jgi:hypothetical protein
MFINSPALPEAMNNIVKWRFYKMRDNKIQDHRAGFDAKLVLLMVLMALGISFKAHAEHRLLDQLEKTSSTEGCFPIFIGFTLVPTFDDEGGAILNGDIISGPLQGGRFDLVNPASAVSVGVGGITRESNIATLSTGSYTTRSGEQIFIEVLTITDREIDKTAGIQTITGGTGIFEDASGSLTGTGALDEDGNRRSHVSGEICFDRN